MKEMAKVLAVIGGVLLVVWLVLSVATTIVTFLLPVMVRAGVFMLGIALIAWIIFISKFTKP